jgi:hemin uptake protein HemP
MIVYRRIKSGNELKGKADGEEYELKITAEGKMIRLKLEEKED